MKTWIKTNLSKITLALALTGATTGAIGLIMGVLTDNMENSYLKPNGEKGIGTTTIWLNKFTSSYKFILYFGNKPIHKGDVVWDGKYPDWYFNQ